MEEISENKDVAGQYNGTLTKALFLKNKKLHHIKIRIIRHMPIVFLIFLLISVILIYYSSSASYDDNKKLILDKFCNLFMGMTIVIAGVYLLCTRMENVAIMNIFNNIIDGEESNK